MKRKAPSQDDLQDVMEMTSKIEKAISNIVADNEKDLAFSALISGSINSLIKLSDNAKEYKHFRDVYITILRDTPGFIDRSMD